jgi:Zn-dependent protease with chaperone function
MNLAWVDCTQAFSFSGRHCKVVPKPAWIILRAEELQETGKPMRSQAKPANLSWTGPYVANRAGVCSIIRFASISLLTLLSVPGLSAQRSQLKPPWNMYSPQTDVQLGRRNAELIEKHVVLCNDPKVDAYLTQLGLRLAAKLPTRGVQYPWEFHCVNSKEINAFALPGGFVFVNRGAIEVSDNEGQLAAVMAHELSHVALRHGTAQASKAQLAQGAAGIFGGLFGGGTGGALLTQTVALGAGGVLLHYSRTDETQADVLGTQALYDTGYDPRAMAQFFEKLEGETRGKNPPQFLSDHPNPGNRVARVDEEIDKLGGPPANAKRDSVEFEAIKREVMALPVVKSGAPTFGAVPPPPSRNFLEYEAPAYRLKYPDNWKKYEEGGSTTFAPDGGVAQSGALAYGMIVSLTKIQMDTADPNGLESITQQFIQDLQKTNPGLRLARNSGRLKLNGEPGLSTYLDNDSPAGGQEADWLITVLRPEGLLSFLCVAPRTAFSDYEKTFTAMFDTVRLAN